MEPIGLVICTTGDRPEQLQQCLATHESAAFLAGVTLRQYVYFDANPIRGDMRHLVDVRNAALNRCAERWTLFCDDDDYVFQDHLLALMAALAGAPLSTVIMTQAKPVGGWTLACSLVNTDRFRMTGWLCPPTGGEDFYTASTLTVRGHLITRDKRTTWQVCDDVPSLTRAERIELK